MSNDLIDVWFEGITSIADAAIYKPERGNSNTFVLIDLYGSESQVRAIFAALVGSDEVRIGGVNVRRNYFNSAMRFKSWRMGYGKYQALIWDANILKETVFSLGDNVEAWDRFLRSKRIPYLKEWIPELSRILETEGLIEKIISLGYINNSWYWQASDDEVCDLIVKKIQTAA